MTDMQSNDGEVLKTDERGRVRTPAERRESLLNEFERSGLSATKFAALAGIKYQTFAAWAARRRKGATAQAPVPPRDPMRWLEAVVDQAQPPRAMVLQLPGGVRAEVSDEKQAELAAMLVRALARSC
jgi:acetyl esterase/lipase